MKTRGGWIVGVAAAMLVAGCAVMDVTSDYDPGFDFASFKTYQWLPGKGKLPGRGEVTDDLLDGHVRRAVEKELTAKGYAPRAHGAPDFLVTFHAIVEDKVYAHVINDYYGGYGYAGYYGYRRTRTGPRVETYQYKQGTLIIDVIDAAARKVVWRGTVEGEVDMYKDPQKRIERLNEAVRRALAQFPPPKK